MIFVRRITIKLGKMSDAIAWAKEIAEYMNEKFGANYSVYTERYGDNPLGTIFWVASFETMQSITEFSDKLLQDEGYLSRMPAGAEFFLSGTTHDSILDKQ